MSSGRCCKNCKFFDGIAVLKEGWCRIAPPLAVPMGSMWPMVKDYDWCGKFKSKEKEKVQDEPAK